MIETGDKYVKDYILNEGVSGRMFYNPSETKIYEIIGVHFSINPLFEVRYRDGRRTRVDIWACLNHKEVVRSNDKLELKVD
jgi:hypothetical protein